MLSKHESPALRMVVLLVHLALWAELGVCTRAFLAKFFSLGCGGSWGPCLDGGAYFKDLPANMLGSYIIGVFAASSTLGLATDKALAVLPRGHPWQHNFELHIGIRTGYCGSLTTFASWQMELITLAVLQKKWAEAFMGYFTGVTSAIVCYVLGMHTALAIDRWLLREQYVLEEMGLYRDDQLAFIQGMRADSGETPTQKLMEQAEPDIPQLRPAHVGGQRELEPGPVLGLGAATSPGMAAAAAAAAAAVAVAGTAEGALGAAEDGREPAAVVMVDESAEDVGLARLSARLMQRRLSAQRQQEDERQQQQQQQQQQGNGKVQEALTPGSFLASMRGYRTDTAALLALTACTAACAVGVGVETRHTWLRTVWMCCLLGPPGCVLRWWLSRFNYKLRGGWDWFPAGTFAANMLGTLIDFALQCVVQRRSLDYWGGLLLASVQTGFCGSLTTVSTFVTEVVKFSEAVPENYRAYSYALISLGGGILLGLGIYGWSVWAG